jgi:hypothetical protein
MPGTAPTPVGLIEKSNTKRRKAKHYTSGIHTPQARGAKNFAEPLQKRQPQGGHGPARRD